MVNSTVKQILSAKKEAFFSLFTEKLIISQSAALHFQAESASRILFSFICKTHLTLSTEILLCPLIGIHIL